MTLSFMTGPLRATWLACSLAGAITAAPLVRAEAVAQPPALAAFATGDGAYYTTIGGKVVDPYFVNKGFIVALQANAPLRGEFAQWIQWLLPRQRKDGGFDRYCLDSKKQWHSCMKADADDSMASTTMQMLALAAEKNWIPAEQAPAARKASSNARKLLNSLLNPSTQLYKVFANTELYYLMDNAEVYEGLRAVGASTAANKLAAAMRSQFYTGTSWKPAIPEYTETRFYPHTLAHAYLWGNSILPANESAAAMAQWLAIHSATWLNRTGDQYAWGLVAWELRVFAPAQAACWRASLRPFSESIGWTLLDAFVDRSLQELGVGTACATAQPSAPAAPPPAAKP